MRPRLASSIRLPVLSALLLASVSGCGGDDDSQGDVSPPGGMSTVEKKETAPPKPPAFSVDGWPAPAAAIVLSGDQHGYLEPCGCSEKQAGGLSRRADLFRRLREKSWPVTAFDLGGLVERDRRQSRIKFETLLTACRKMQYAAIGMGPEELRLGPDYLLSQNVPGGEGQPALPKFLGANVVFFGLPGIEGAPAPQSVVGVGEVTIGVTAVVGSKPAEPDFPAASPGDITLRAPEQVLPGVVDALKAAKPDLLVLLAHAKESEARALAEAFPDFDLVLFSGAEEPSVDPDFVGKTMLVSVGQKGKRVGVVGFYPKAEKERLRFASVALDKDRFDDSPAMIDLLQTYVDRLRRERLVVVEPPVAHPLGTTFVGSESCGECHTKAYAKWSKTKHAHAFESLDPANERHGHERLKGISRVFDPECLACHVTGWWPQKALRYETGFVNPVFLDEPAEKEHARLLRGNGCENCHGPGSRHVELEQQWLTAPEPGEKEALLAARREVRRTRAEAERQTCYRCHDLDNSPDFQFDEYWPKIRHPWRD